MKPPWKDRSGNAKTIAVLATMLLVSAGGCGVNFLLLFTGVVNKYGYWEANGWFLGSGLLEMLVFGFSAVSLAVVLLDLGSAWVIEKVKAKWFGKGSSENHVGKDPHS